MMQPVARDYFHELYAIAIKINSPIRVRGVLRSVVRNTMQALDAKGCSIMLLTPDKKSLVHTISCGLSRGFIARGPRSVRKSLPETVRGRGQITIVHDIVLEADRVQYPEAARKEGIVSLIAVPMKVRNRTVGELRVYTGTEREFTEDEVFFVQAVANLGALAMDNARLYEATENLLIAI
jgi:transcriptional regulator with GAF, ATPase, and Fis domain